MKKYFLIAYLITINKSAYDPNIPTTDILPNEEKINTAPSRVPDKDNGISDGALVEKEEKPEDVENKIEKARRAKKIKEGKLSPLKVY